MDPLLHKPRLKNWFILIMAALLLTGCRDDMQVYQEDINLSGKGLTEIPPEVFHNKKLKGLGLGPKGFMAYGNISVMPDSPNYITVIPEEIGELTELRRLNLSCNKVTRLPGSFANLKNIEFLDLSFNELDIHDEKQKFYGMHKLKYLSIMGNRLDSSDLADLRKHLNPQVRIMTTLKDLQSR